MKHLNKRILDISLTVLMIVSLTVAAFVADVDSVEMISSSVENQVLSAKGATTNSTSKSTSKSTSSSKKSSSKKSSSGKSGGRTSGVVCWGDSLTCGLGGGGMSYPAALAGIYAASGRNVDVVNLGACGDNSISIAAKSGGIPCLLRSDVVIPGDCIPVPVSLCTPDGRQIDMSRFDDIGVNGCVLAGVPGVLTNVVRGTEGAMAQYTFTRAVAGAPVVAAAGTPLATWASMNYKNYASVIFIGNNGGFTDYNDLIAQQNAIAASRSGKKYIVVGITLNNAVPDFATYDAVMAQTYGSRYLNFRQYVASIDLTAYGIVPSAADYSLMAQGQLPLCIKSDANHLNSIGYQILAQAVYQKLSALGY